MIPKVTAQFLAAMERILWLYALPYDPQFPVICFDERPCFLIGETVEPISMQSGQVAKEHYAYEKNGSCVVLAAIEPLTGRRLAHVRAQRTMKEFTIFCQELANTYAEATKIRLVFDNLNTHGESAFYTHLPADEAFALAQRFEFYYTPKAASWLNMIEIEFSALARLCLNRRIPTITQLEAQVIPFFNDRTEKQIKINWLFSVDDCREKLNKKYATVNDANDKFKNI